MIFVAFQKRDYPTQLRDRLCRRVKAWRLLVALETIAKKSRKGQRQHNVGLDVLENDVHDEASHGDGDSKRRNSAAP